MLLSRTRDDRSTERFLLMYRIDRDAEIRLSTFPVRTTRLRESVGQGNGCDVRRQNCHGQQPASWNRCPSIEVQVDGEVTCSKRRRDSATSHRAQNAGLQQARHGSRDLRTIMPQFAPPALVPQSAI